MASEYLTKCPKNAQKPFIFQYLGVIPGPRKKAMRNPELGDISG
jgi:hypothetical protein